MKSLLIALLMGAPSAQAVTTYTWDCTTSQNNKIVISADSFSAAVTINGKVESDVQIKTYRGGGTFYTLPSYVQGQDLIIVINDLSGAPNHYTMVGQGNAKDAMQCVASQSNDNAGDNGVLRF